MGNLISKIHEFAIPDLDQSDIDLLRKYRLYINTCLLSAFFGVCYGIISYFIGFQVGVWTMVLSVVFFLACAIAVKKVNLRLMAFAISLYQIWLNGILVYYSGGLFVSPVSPWITLTAPLILLIAGRKTAITVLLVCIGYVLGYSYLLSTGYEFPFTYPEKYQLPFLALAMSGLVAIFFLIAYTFEDLKKQALDSLLVKQKELSRERERSENLLLNMFPEDIAEELKATGKTKATLHENATVLFADIKNFTILSEGLSPDQLVELLGEYFQRIDALIKKNGLEKIKTIGDAYLATAGVPATNSASVKDVIQAAIEIQTEIKKYNLIRQEEGKACFEFRIGINTGTVVAGVVGDLKYVYDIWGDAVNVAARLEENSQPGRINISSYTYEHIKHDFEFEPRGEIDAKNKGLIEMFWVVDHE